MITVKVVRQSDGKLVENAKVTLGFSELMRWTTTNSEHTDRNGEAHFDADNGNGEVYVNGKNEHKGYLSGRIVIYI